MKSIIKIFGSALFVSALLLMSQSATAQSKNLTTDQLDALVQEQAADLGLIAKKDYDEANMGMSYDEYMRDMRMMVKVPQQPRSEAKVVTEEMQTGPKTAQASASGSEGTKEEDDQ